MTDSLPADLPPELPPLDFTAFVAQRLDVTREQAVLVLTDWLARYESPERRPIHGIDDRAEPNDSERRVRRAKAVERVSTAA